MTNSQILVVNGSSNQRRETRTLLERAGYSVSEIVSTEVALAWAMRNPLSAMVVEASENTSRAIEFAHRIRRQPMTASVPIVLMNCDSGEERTSEVQDTVSVLYDPCPPRYLLQELAYLTRMTGDAVPRASARSSDGPTPRPTGSIPRRTIRSSAVATLVDAYGSPPDLPATGR